MHTASIQSEHDLKELPYAYCSIPTQAVYILFLNHPLERESI